MGTMLNGYQEIINVSDGSLWFKGFNNNGEEIDYEEFYNFYGKLIKSFYI